MTNPDTRESTRAPSESPDYTEGDQDEVEDTDSPDEEENAATADSVVPEEDDDTDEEENSTHQMMPEDDDGEAEPDEEDPGEADEEEEDNLPAKRNGAASVKDIYRAASAPIEVEARSGEGETLHGYFSVFNNPYRISSFWEGDFYEKVEPGAFARAINERGNSIRVLLEHGYDPQVGNKPLGKMQKIEEDSRGGAYEAKLYTEASYVKDLLPALRDGNYEASFRFRVREESWDYEPESTDWNPNGIPVRTLKDVDVIEVGPCLFGANPEASSGVRSMTDKYNTGLAHAARDAESMHDMTNGSRKVEEGPQGVPAEEAPEKPEVRQEDESGEETRIEDSTPDTTTANEKGQAKMPKSLNERRAELQAMQARRDAISDAAGEYELTEEARTEYDKLATDAETLRASIEFDEKRLADVRARHEAGKVEGGARVTSEPEVYRQGGNQSFFKDLFRARYSNDSGAADRLTRNDRMVSEARAGMTTVDGAGGEFVPPVWMIDKFIGLATAGRVIADNVAKEAMPPGTDSINYPSITGAPSVAAQATQNTALSETDMTTGSVTADLETVGGLQTVSLQELERSPLNLDPIILRELVKQYAIKVDNFVINNNATNKKGLLQVSGINTVTYTDASPTGSELYPKFHNAVQLIHTLRFDSPTRVFMHPRRWHWLASQVDSQGRPLVLPLNMAPQNAVALAGGLEAQGFVGSMGVGLPVFVDPNLPTNLGTGTNEDIIIVAKADDNVLFEDTPRLEVSREMKFDKAAAVFRIYNYVAFTNLYSKSIATIGGTGLVTPAF